MRRNADTGVSRSATSSLTTGTKVLRRASSVNASKEVCFITRSTPLVSSTLPVVACRSTIRIGLLLARRAYRGRQSCRSRHLFQQPRFHRVVNQVVYDPPVERTFERRFVDIGKHADWRCIHKQVPA